MITLHISHNGNLSSIGREISEALGIIYEKRESYNMGGEYIRYNCLFGDIRLILYESKFLLFIHDLYFDFDKNNVIRKARDDLFRKDIHSRLYDYDTEEYIDG